MKHQFCTITTASHLYKVYALAESLKNQQHDFLLTVLVIDDEGKFVSDNCRFLTLAEIEKQESAKDIIRKYRYHKDKLRWSLKAVLMKYLLGQANSTKVIYLDNDLYFFSDYSFLFDLLGDHTFLLTPHHYKNDPNENQNWLEANFRIGLYNAGFVGANKNALNTLQWWADCCLYRCEKNLFRGMFDDQKYLDLIPVIEPMAHIVRHKGCNIAGWNVDVCRREIVDHRVLIDGRYEIVFMHFNENTVREILSGPDAILFNYYRVYVESLKRHRDNLRKGELYFERRLSDRLKLGLWRVLTKMEV
jgi:hypothetical protein